MPLSLWQWSCCLLLGDKVEEVTCISTAFYDLYAIDHQFVIYLWGFMYKCYYTSVTHFLYQLNQVSFASFRFHCCWFWFWSYCHFGIYCGKKCFWEGLWTLYCAVILSSLLFVALSWAICCFCVMSFVILSTQTLIYLFLDSFQHWLCFVYETGQ